ncbi:MAG: efflux RND transporter permease subunit [Spirochaetes bacterium]|nr:efflux RND transporter permease subunit [Spirochaetota bacterium]
MKISERAVRHPVTTILLFVTLAALGFLSSRRVGLEQFPDIGFPTAAIFTIYPGVGPFEVESGVTRPIEEAVSTLNGIEKVSSTSSDGLSLVIVNFNWGTDMTGMVADIREKISSIEADLPEGAERAAIYKFNPQVLPVLTLTFSSSDPGIDVRRLVEKQVLPAIERQEGVASASVYGGRRAAVTVRLDLDRLSANGVPVLQVVQAFSADNVSLPGGSVSLGDREVVLRTIGEFQSLDDIRTMVVGANGTSVVRLRDVAEVALDALPQEEFVRAGTAAAESADAVLVDVQKMQGRNTVKVIDAVKRAVKDLQAGLPPSLDVEVRTDQSVSIRESISSLTDAAWQGGLLAVLVLLFFLRNLRSVAIVAVSIPVSVIATFLLMDLAGIDLNIMSLAGLTLGVGMFVDNSIVVLEVVFRKQLAGMTPGEAAIAGTGEVTTAVVASTLTNVVVFLPLVFVTGLANIIMRDLAYTLSFSMMMSLLMALALVPVLCARYLRLPRGATILPPVLHGEKVDLEISLADVQLHTGNRIVDAAAGWVQRVIRWLDESYERVLAWALRRSGWVLGGAAVLLAASLASIVLLGMEFLPETDEGRFAISIETRAESSYARTAGKVQEVERIVRDELGADLASLSSVVGRSGGTRLGSTGSHVAEVSVVLTAKDRRRRDIWTATSVLARRIASEVRDVKAGISIEGIASLVNLVSGDTNPVVVEIEGADLSRSLALAGSVAGVIRATAGSRDVDVSYRTGKSELQLRVKHEEAAGLGISPLAVAATVRAAYKGVEVSRYRQGDDTWDVHVRVRDEDRGSLTRVNGLFLVNPAGARVPLENLVEFQQDSGPVSVQRSNKVRLVKVTAALTGERPLDRVVADVRRGIDALGPVPSGLKVAVTGTRSQMADTFRQLALALLLGAGLVYVVMAAQFESLLHPFIVMFSIPFAVIGLVAALFITNTPFSMVAFIGAILLVGYVVNNAILLIDYFNVLRKSGLPLDKAITIGGRTRLKPILMSTVTTILGLLPMALGIGTGSELRAPMARAVFGGLASSTLITLVLIPVIYRLVESRRKVRTP